MRSRWMLLPLFPAATVTMILACSPGTSPGEGESEEDPEVNNGPPTCTVDGVELLKPTEHATLDTGEAPDWSCLGNAPVLPASENVTVQGCVDIFGLGGKAKPGLKIAFFDVDQDPQNDTPAYGEADIAVKAEGSEEASNCSKEGWYTMPNIPTNTPLTIKTYDTAEGAAQTGIPTYTYWHYIYDEDVTDGVALYEANLVYKTTYDSIPTLGGKRIDGQQIIYDGEGRAVIAGEIHDCNGDLVENAAVTSTIFDSSTKMAYFDGDEEDPTPDLARTVTNFDALYVVLNAATDEGNNQHGIRTAILDPTCEADDLSECECVSAGGADVMAFPDSVTIMSPEGTFPE